MKTNLLFTTLLIGLGFSTTAQNLIPNPSFETQTSCPLVSEIEKAVPWNSANLGTPDLFDSTCPSQNSPARTGSGSAGFYASSNFPNNREYVQVELTSSLIAGNKYCIEFYVKPTGFRLGVAQIGAFLSNNELNRPTTGFIDEMPMVINTSGPITNSGVWTKIEGEYTATGGEKYISFGNFSDDANTTTGIVNGSSTDTIAYYKIDDVSVIDCTPQDTTGTSIRALNDKLVALSPNPSEGIVTIDYPSNNEEFTLTIYDVLGREVDNFELRGVRNQLNLSTYKSGTYLVTIMAKNELVSISKLMIH